ncbi:MAG: hypothetical protein NVSMB64_20370 [Candidatus Velthaea sp.]
MSSTSARTQPFAAQGTLAGSVGPLIAILAAGLVLRLAFISGSGFHNDISAFEAWALTLTEHPLSRFYQSTSFADYPPGYFFVLLAIGWIYKGLVGLHLIAPSAYGVLGMLVKLPAIAMDLVDAYLVYAIVQRFASRTAALGAAALFALNPAAIYISAYWGQVDSVSWGLVLLGINLLLSARGDAPRGVPKIAGAWLALSFSVLMKPQGTFVGLVFLAFAFVASDPAERKRRLAGTALGFAGGLFIAWLASATFHGTLDPIADFSWLLQRYTFASSVYPYNSINAFNLYAIKNQFWQADDFPLSLFGVSLGPTMVWGWILVLGACALIVARYLQRKDDRAFLEAAMLVSFAFFIFATRMHERYSFGAFMLLIPLIAFGRVYLWSAIAVSFTLLVNLAYSLNYQTVMEQKTPNVNVTDLLPLVSHPLAALNTALFFGLGYLFLGGAVALLDSPAVAAGGAKIATSAGIAWLRVRSWFDPREGLAAFGRWDWVLSALFVLASFVVCIMWYQWPAERYFDEVYYPRAGEEYLQHKEIFEYTHPPLTKLIVTLSMLIVGHGNGLSAVADSGFGWRFLNIVIGALTVGVLYAFAKRLTRSTLFASIGAGMLLFDGFHYVQARIATPEITVAFFSLCTLYAFYRLWICAQVARKPVVWTRNYLMALAAVMAVGTALAILVSALLTNWRTPTTGEEFRSVTYAIIFLYVEALVYLGARLALPRLMRALSVETSYADGTRVRRSGGTFTAALPEGKLVTKAETRRDADGLTRTYEGDGGLTYATPAGAASFTPDGVMKVAGFRIDTADARIWLIVLAISSAALAASKWNGLFDFFVVWGIAALVFAQRWLRRPAFFGNPFGISLDVLILGMLVVGGAVYAASYIPYFALGHNFIDLVSLQKQMYWYHSTLKATHPYASQWWQWPILQKPISYFYHDFRVGEAMKDPAACCVAEILALPNPFVWWLGLLSIPFAGFLAWKERNKGYALLVVAYFLQWLPWIGSPRIAFEYHFYPNLAMIVLANTVLLQRIWNWRAELAAAGTTWTMPRIGVALYCITVAIAFVYFYPVLAGVHVTWSQWHDRMWFPSWII